MRNHVDFSLIKGNKDETEFYSDPERLTNILNNLLNNSLFFTNEGFVRFGYRKLSSGIEFFVEDSGAGIEDKNKEMIFKPFFKGNNHVIGHKGFGLGLAITKGMVSLLGGELKFDSSPNIGSRFYFELKNREALKLISRRKSEQKKTRLFTWFILQFLLQLPACLCSIRIRGKLYGILLLFRNLNK